LNSWSINTIPQWTIISKDLSQELSKTDIPQINIEKVHNYVHELVGTIAEAMYKADSESPQKFLFKQILPLFGGGNTRRKGTDIETDLDIMQMDTTQLDEESIAKTGQILEEFNQSLLSVQDQLLKLLDISESDLKTEDRLLNIIHLTLHISEFEEKYKELQSNRMNKRSSKLKVSYDSDDAFLLELENNLKELKEEFYHFLEHIQLPREYFSIHIQERIGDHYSAFINELLMKHLSKMDYPNLIKLTEKLYKHSKFS